MHFFTLSKYRLTSTICARLRNILTLLVVALWKSFCHQLVFFLGVKIGDEMKWYADCRSVRQAFFSETTSKQLLYNFLWIWVKVLRTQLKITTKIWQRSRNCKLRSVPFWIFTLTMSRYILSLTFNLKITSLSSQEGWLTECPRWSCLYHSSIISVTSRRKLCFVTFSIRDVSGNSAKDVLRLSDESVWTLHTVVEYLLNFRVITCDLTNAISLQTSTVTEFVNA